jgi:hypothetical protein
MVEISTPPTEVTLTPENTLECDLIGLTSLEAVAMSIKGSLISWVIEYQGEPVAYWGFMPGSVCGNWCQAWMLSTPRAAEVPLVVALASKRAMAYLHDRYNAVVVNVDIRHGKAIKWLEWLGFTQSLRAPPFIIMTSERVEHGDT